MSSARQQAASHIRAALDTGVRGDVREYLTKALRAAEGERAASLGKLHYDALAVGAKLGDPDRPGLVMRHGKRTGRVWLYRHSDPVTGKKVEHQLGTYPALGIADARARWGELREGVTAGRSVEVEVEAGVMTMGQLVDRYLTDYARPTKRSWKMDESYLTRHVLPHYAVLPATEFTADHVRAILGPISERTPREAEKVRGVLSSMFSVAIRGSRKIGNLAGSTWLPPDTQNPAMQVVLPARQTKSHTPTEAELRALLQAADGAGVVGQAIILQAQTCARVTEVAALPWSEVDLDAGVWTLPAERSKNGRSHAVMLSGQSVALLRQRRAQTNGDFVFPGARFAPHLTRNAVGKTIARIRPNPAFTSHSLRHAALTWLAENGAGRDIRDRISNHTDSTGGADAIYNAATLNRPAREWLQKWCDYLD